MKMITAVAFLLGLVACTHSQENIPSADEVLQQVGGVIGNIPELNNLNVSALPNIEEAKNLFKEKCTKNGGADAFDNAQRAQVDMVHCLQSLINITELQAEMEKYKPTGDLDIVFKNYCNKRSILRACVNNFTNTVEHCLDEKERENKKIVLNITDSLLEFICYKEGDRIALFISAGGPECFQSKQQAIQDCANNTYGGYIPKTDPSNNLIGLESLPSLTFGTRECRDMANLQVCVVAELEKCSDPTPANIMDSIFNFVKRVTPCENVLNAQSAAATGTKSASGASHVTGALSTLAIIPFIVASYSNFIPATM
ncbi:interferon-related developmental regulator 1-like protein [Lasius niger]|uniref:Interferon-related developmental regulator 1-like protein n=1 Tax=Lasius niger TaxID=67767 RepID=A0A0J7L587_LASNI|nr:interferon-related developmental regulator 1-like protein [Lasius niger]